jgi:hypothetical protein
VLPDRIDNVVTFAYVSDVAINSKMQPGYIYISYHKILQYAAPVAVKTNAVHIISVPGVQIERGSCAQLRDGT